MKKTIEFTHQKICEPSCRKLELIGATGAGKTETACALAGEEARKLLRLGVGMTNSTLVDTGIVYTDNPAYSNILLVCAKPRPQIMPRPVFTQVLAQTYATVTHSGGKIAIHDAIESEMDLRNNSSAVALLGFLSTAQLDDFATAVENIFFNDLGEERAQDILSTAKDTLPPDMAKGSSKKLMKALQTEFAKAFDSDLQLSDSLKTLHEQLESELLEIFNAAFQAEMISDDGYYVRQLDLPYNKDTDSAFVEAFFTSNDIEKGGRLSLTTMCSDVVLYVPLADKIKNGIADNPFVSNVFKDPFGNIVFAVWDTRGFFHKGIDPSVEVESEKTDPKERMASLIFDSSPDAAIIVNPFRGDTNSKEANALYRHSLKKLQKSVPIAILGTKLDLFADELWKDSANNIDELQDTGLETDFVAANICAAIEDMRTELSSPKAKNERLGATTEFFATYYKRSPVLSGGIAVQYHPCTVIVEMLQWIAKKINSNCTRPRFILKCEENNNIEPSFDFSVLYNLLSAHILTASAASSMAGILGNVSSCLPKIPHGNSYRALRRRLEYGRGYSCSINEDFFTNVESFSFTVPGQICNEKFTPGTLVQALVQSALKLSPDITPESKKDLDDFVDCVIKRFSRERVASEILFFNALLPAEKESFSFGGIFKGLMLNTRRNIRDLNAITKAFAVALTEAARAAMMQDVTFV